jgi:GNAT superfamily N-acetyltransferase
MNSDAFEELRTMQLKDLKAQIHDPIEEVIITYKADFIGIVKDTETVGYACIGTYEEYKNTILEYYLLPRYRRYSTQLLMKLAKISRCNKWIVNTQDFFALPIMLDLELKYEINGYIFTFDNSKNLNIDFGQGVSFEVTRIDELEKVYELIKQDDFYTGGGIETVEARIIEETLYSLKRDGRLIGIGFVDILKRTPLYADIAMIIDGNERGNGLGTLLVKALIGESKARNIIPTALTGVSNKISRNTLQKAGFYLDGCILEVYI